MTDTLYNGFYKKIHATTLLEPNEVVESVIGGSIKQSRPFPYLNNPQARQLVQSEWKSAVAAALAPVSEFDPLIRDHNVESWGPEKEFYSEIKSNIEIPPTELSAAQALKYPKGRLGVDIRPHLHDSLSNQDLLCDSGSQITAWPPDPGDKPLPTTFLKAVNGSKLNCYGYKQVSIQIGRKNYRFQAIKADVQAPIIGWDFFKHYRIDFRWTEFGDVELYDKKAKKRKARI